MRKQKAFIIKLTVTAMLIALYFVFDRFTAINLLSNQYKLSFIPLIIGAVFFGPICGIAVGGLGDLISALLMPTGAYFPGFTISGALTGLIYGFFLYKYPLTLPRVSLAWVVNTLVVETFLAAYWLFLLYSAGTGKGYEVWLLSRVISQAVKAVPEILLIFIVGRLAVNAHKRLEGSYK